MTLYYGTDEETAIRFLRGELLDVAKASPRKIDGPPGFFLATTIIDAEFFALRRGRGVVIEFDIRESALQQLIRDGAVFRPIPVGQRSTRFSGDELMVPVTVFETLIDLLSSGEMTVNPVK